MKNTPGPWKVTKHKDYECYSIHTGDVPQEGEEIDNSVAGVWDMSEEGLSNAHLIASAPDLLEALEKLYFAVYGGNSVSLNDAINRSVKTDEFEQSIISAIKKARGL